MSSLIKLNQIKDQEIIIPITKQGIVTILPCSSDHITNNNKQSSTLRRTLSADMSSLKLLNQNAPTLKKISSHQEIVNMIIPNSPSNSSSSSASEDHENRPGTDEIWRSIQSQKLIKKESSSSSDDWGSVILTQKSTSDLPPPYIHPLVKKSSNTLSVKSLQICTENLGSETGSDAFYPSSKNEEDNNNKEQDQIKEITNIFDHVVKCNNKVTSPVRPFPPPLPSIDGSASLQMQSHRKDGRLVVEAVSVPSRNYFHSQRKDGRLVLTLIKNQEFHHDGIETTVNEQVVRSLPSEINITSTIVHKSSSGFKKNPNPNPNPNPMSIKKFNKTFNMMEADAEISVPHSLPLPPRVPRMIPTSPPCANSTFNTYNYFWRNTNNTVSAGNTKQYLPTNQKKSSYEHQDLVVMRKNKTEYFVPYLKGCKEGRRRSVSIWEPYCIATS